MDVQVGVEVQLLDLGRVDLVQPVLGRDFRRDVIVESLQGVAHVAVLVDFPVDTAQVAVHDLRGAAQKLFGVAQLGVLLAVKDVSLGRGGAALFDQDALHQVLNLLHRGHAAVVEQDRQIAFDLARHLLALLLGF